MTHIMIVTAPIGKAGISPLLALIKIFEYSSNSISIITGNDFNEKLIKKNAFAYLSYNYDLKGFKKLFEFIWMQSKISFYIFKEKNNINSVFFLYGTSLFLPVLTSKIFNKKIIMILTGSSSSSCKSRGSIYSSAIEAIERISYLVSDSLIVYSPRLIEKWDLQDYANKILIAHRHFLDFEAFTITTPLSDRHLLIGYIGRLSGEKGIQNFAQALPAILSHQQDLRVLICGDGQLKESIEASLLEGGIAARVDLPGWISHDDLPRYLNQLRLLVLPSYTEGLPNIMLEAMACGTPVLATPVGAVPDVIVDGKTGFIMENNSPKYIAENVVRALEHPDLERIAEAGRRLVEENFTFERVVERWKEVLDEI
ncbi:glycosyltransferase family 4 protein [Methanosaeta sp. UBA356]|uniref:glycosyltransferase family 4 protein n=1 Tax=Methanosaeta sp. UBA356 TaxID=1915559 RepID=UPI002579A72B|nr:glycosyltransferase family 4 protein [Methanosaeta sp. UBA356]